VTLNSVITEHADAWLAKLIAAQELDILSDPNSTTLKACPIGAIRIQEQDGLETLLGHVYIFRCRSMSVMPEALDGSKLASELLDENNARQPEDPETIWSIGCEYSFPLES
jgi:hypothetical protein